MKDTTGKFIVGLTGGVASGKSLVSRELERLGARVIDADKLSREITAPGAPAYLEIVEEFGRSVVLEDGTLDRKAMGAVVFSDPARLKRLNAITHPRIRERIYMEISAIDQRDGDPLIVVDAALLVETGLFKEMDRVVVVYAGEDEQTERLMKRNGLDRAEAGRRVAAQMPLGEKTRYADHVIDNSGPAAAAVEETQRLYARLRAEAKKKVDSPG